MKFINNLILIAFVVLLLVGCGKKMDPAFESQFQAFEAASLARGRSTAGDDKISIQFVSSLPTAGNGNEEIASCQGTSIIAISQSEYNKLDATQQEIVIMHELGHCLLGRVHRPETDYRESLMIPILLDESFYGHNRDAYLDELFANPKP